MGHESGPYLWEIHGKFSGKSEEIHGAFSWPHEKPMKVPGKYHKKFMAFSRLLIFIVSIEVSPVILITHAHANREYKCNS